MTPAAIRTHNLARTFGRTTALAPTTLDVPTGSIFALLGHNGAGKTTLIKTVANILRPTSGSAEVLGLPSTAIAGDAFTRIGYVSENQDLPSWMTVRAFLAYMRGFYPTWDDAAFTARFDFPLTRKLKHLSRGQRMKVALASVLAFSPELIILDEPFSGLDPVVRDELIEALLDTAATRPTTILLSSHDLAEIESFATHVAFLDHGRLLFEEDLETLTARFREVTVSLPSIGAPTADAFVRTRTPAHWLLTRRKDHQLRFVHSQAQTQSIDAEVRTLYPEATAVDIAPMNLRTIFLAVVKSQRQQAGDAQ